jgi:DNA-binding NarL/FixJ family response regulator
MKNHIRDLSVDDCLVIREGIVGVMNGQPDIQVVRKPRTGMRPWGNSVSIGPSDLILMDLRPPGTRDIDNSQTVVKIDSDVVRPEWLLGIFAMSQADLAFPTCLGPGP